MRRQIKVKFCGITRLEDALYAVKTGAAYLGFIFVKKSPRYITPEQAKEIIEQLPKKIKKVGVFVNEDMDDIIEIAEACGLDIIQLHGDEPPEFAEKLGSERIWKSFSLKTKDQVAAICDFPCQYVLTDSANATQRGGTGTVCDWSLAREVATRRPLALAGGISPDNLLKALQKVNPEIVDINSGVETAPGVKDHDKMLKIMEIIKQYNEGNKQ